MAKRVVAIMGSYRVGGVVDTVVDEVLDGARAAGADVHKIDLVTREIQFCHNCRQCTQEPGEQRGTCPVEDDVDAILTELERADGIVLGAPVNFGDVNALTRQFLERMVGYGHWPWGRPSPRLRQSGAHRPCVLVTSSAARGLTTRWLARPIRTLVQMARLLGARPIAKLVIGLAGDRDFRLSERTRRAARRAGGRLVA